MPNGTFPAANGTTHGVIVFAGPHNSGPVQAATFALGVANNDSRANGHVWFFGGAGGIDSPDAPVLLDLDYELRGNTIWSHACPEETAYIVVSVAETNQVVDWYVELLAK